MSLQQAVQAKNSNGFGRRNFDREMGTRTDNKSRPGRSSSGGFGNPGLANGGKVSFSDGPSRDRLVYATTCLIGHPVEVQVKNGCVYSGIFHAMNAEREFGVILKMARVVKDVSLGGSKLHSDPVSKPPSKMLIIPGKEVMQVIAKDVSFSGDGSIHGHIHDNKQDILIDSFISQSHYAEERELERWIPDGDDPQCPELENIFDGTWNSRKWDQFQTNEALFGVKSTFNEELYTTKLERGPQMREREREALRIAREIEGEETKDIHLAEERGIHLSDDLDIDEETRFSSVYRGIDDGRYEENEDNVIDSSNSDTFGSSRVSASSRFIPDGIRGKVNGVEALSSGPSMDEEFASRVHTGKEPNASSCDDQLKQQALDGSSRNIHLVDADSRLNDNQHMEQPKKLTQCKHMPGEAESLKSDEMHQLRAMKKSSSDKCASPPIHTSSSASSSSQALEHTCQPDDLDLTKSSKAVRQTTNFRLRPSSSASSASEHVSAAAASGLSPSSSVGSLSSEKSTLNPNAKEFKFNPNAKSFTPSAASFMPSGPSEGSFYYHSGVSAVPPIPGLPMGIGMGTSFGGQHPVIYSPQGAPMLSHQGYVHPNGPLYGQQVFVGQPRPMLYTPNYPPDTHFKGREY